jgi:hypothetical protein
MPCFFFLIGFNCRSASDISSVSVGYESGSEDAGSAGSESGGSVL